MFDKGFYKLILILILLLDLLLLLFIGFSISFLKSRYKYMMEIILIPLSITFFFILLKRVKFYANFPNKTNQIEVKDKKVSNVLLNDKKYLITLSNDNKIVLLIKTKKYIFNLKSILKLLVAGPSLALLIYFFFTLKINDWFQELVATQSKFLLKYLFNLESIVLYSSEGDSYWSLLLVQNNESYSFDPMCTAIHVFSIFSGLIICIPKSQDPKTGEDIVWRKTKTLVLSISIIYIINLIRIIILIYFAYLGVPWNIFHTVVNYISGILAALIFLALLNAWLPEIFLSIYYLYPLFKIAKNRKKISGIL